MLFRSLPHPPYEILENRLIDFATMQRLRRFAKYWDLVGNSGNFVESAPLLWSRGETPFRTFLRFSDWLHQRIGRTDSIALARLAEQLFTHLTTVTGVDAATAATALMNDWQRCGRRDPPECARPFLPQGKASIATRRREGPRRQSRHQAPAAPALEQVRTGDEPRHEPS